jgi:hypothetical protein
MSGITGAAAKVGRTRRGLLPSGQLLTPEVWARRHRGIVWLLWLHVAGIAAFAVARGNGLGHGLEERRWGRCSRCRPPTRPWAAGPGRRRPCSG